VDRARRLLAQIDEVMRHPCDLDLLIFFARHQRTLMGSEQLAILLGYEFKQIAVSLDILEPPHRVREPDLFSAADVRVRRRRPERCVAARSPPARVHTGRAARAGAAVETALGREDERSCCGTRRACPDGRAWPAAQAWFR
jgi:hypothetical protein